MGEQKQLFGKVAKVMSAVRVLRKDGTNSYDKYQYITADSAFEVIGRAMADVNLVALPSVVELTTEEGRSSNDKVQLRTLIHGQITLACGDTGETWTSDWWGEGVDRGDKSVNKAMTAMMKYYLLRLFMVGSGDDADAESPEIEQRKPSATHRGARPPAQALPANPVPMDADNPFDDELQSISVATAKPVNPNGNTWPVTEEQLEYASGLVHDEQLKLSDMATRMIMYFSNADDNSGDKRLSERQYGLLAGKIDARYGKPSHRAILSALCGRVVTGEDMPGWKCKELIDWLMKPDENRGKLAPLDDVAKAIQEAAYPAM